MRPSEGYSKRQKDWRMGGSQKARLMPQLKKMEDGGWKMARAW